MSSAEPFDITGIKVPESSFNFSSFSFAAVEEEEEEEGVDDDEEEEEDEEEENDEVEEDDEEEEEEEEEEEVLVECAIFPCSLLSSELFNISNKYFPAAILNFSSVGFNNTGGTWTGPVESCVVISTGLKAKESSDKQEIKERNAKLSTAFILFNNDITALCSCISVTDKGLFFSYLSLLEFELKFEFKFEFKFSMGRGRDNTTTISNNI